MKTEKCISRPRGLVGIAFMFNKEIEVKYAIHLLMICLVSTSANCFAQTFNAGASTTGRAISVDMFFLNEKELSFGSYLRLFVDSKTYEGDTGSICNDGSITNSIESGACSSSGGLDHIQKTTFNRFGLMFGPTYRLTKSLLFHMGIEAGMFPSKEPYGENSETFSLEWGLDFGVSYKLPLQFDMNMMVSYETERGQPYIGLWFPFR